MKGGDFMKWVPSIFIFCLMGCATVSTHRPEFYQSSTATKVGKVVVVSGVLYSVGAFSLMGIVLVPAAVYFFEDVKLRKVYPECKEVGYSEGMCVGMVECQESLIKCVNEIDVKEGRINPGDLQTDRTKGPDN